MNSPLEVVKKDINIIIYDFSIANILEDRKLTLINKLMSHFLLKVLVSVDHLS